MVSSKKQILVFDYDRTLTLDNLLIPEKAKDTLIAVREKRLATLGIVSGRLLSFLQSVNESVHQIFSFLVAENGAVVYNAESKEKKIFGKEWADRAKRIFPDSRLGVRFGEVMGATRVENADKIEKALSEVGLDSYLVRNRDSLLLLPPGVGKGSGVSDAITLFGTRNELELTCFGDGENDVSLFEPADIRVAVSNAVPELKKIADVVTKSPGGLGVEEYIRNKFMQ